MTEKDKKQLMALGAIIVIVAGVLVYVYRDRFLPQPEGSGKDIAGPPRLDAPVELKDEVLEREDLNDLESFGEIKITPPPLPDRSASGGSDTDTDLEEGTTDEEETISPSF